MMDLMWLSALFIGAAVGFFISTLRYNRRIFVVSSKSVSVNSDSLLSLDNVGVIVNPKGEMKAWVSISELRHSVSLKWIKLLLLRHKLKLASILKEQMGYLEEWSRLERDHSNSLLGATGALKASTLRLPIIGKAVEVRVQFSGFEVEEDEWINVKKHVRQRSLPCEASECVAVLVGDLVLCFQEGKDQALYFDAIVLDAQRRRHDVRGCRCSSWISLVLGLMS